MGRRLSIAEQVPLNLIILLILIIFNGKVIPTRQYDFMKLGIRWPASYCNSKTIRSNTRACKQPISTHFVIHGYFPMYWDPNAARGNHESFVPPYRDYLAADSCSAVRPTAEPFVSTTLFGDNLENMMKYWPFVFDYSNVTASISFWRTHWTKYGKCSQHPQNPLSYFMEPLTYIMNTDFLAILEGGGIKPDNQGYDPRIISATIKEKLGVKVQVRCSKDNLNNEQFTEILLCFGRSRKATNCRTPYYDCKDVAPDQNIMFPNPIVAV